MEQQQQHTNIKSNEPIPVHPTLTEDIKMEIPITIDTTSNEQSKRIHMVDYVEPQLQTTTAVSQTSLLISTENIATPENETTDTCKQQGRIKRKHNNGTRRTKRRKHNTDTILERQMVKLMASPTTPSHYTHATQVFLHRHYHHHQT